MKIRCPVSLILLSIIFSVSCASLSEDKANRKAQRTIEKAEDIHSLTILQVKMIEKSQLIIKLINSLILTKYHHFMNQD